MMDTHQVKAVCERKLGITFRTGGHYVGWYELNGVKICRITIPMGRKDIPLKTGKSMAEQLKLTVSEFKELLACPLSREAYDQLLPERPGLQS